MSERQTTLAVDLPQSELETFFDWRTGLLSQLKLTSLWINLYLSTPVLLPACALWSTSVWSTSKTRLSFAEAAFAYALFLIFFFAEFLRGANDALNRVPKADRKKFKTPRVNLIRRKLKRPTNEKRSKRTKRNRLDYPTIDWSAEKYVKLANTIRENGIALSKITGRLEVSDSWNIHIYQSLRPSRLNSCSFLLGLLVGLWLLHYLGVPWQILVVLCLVTSLVLTLYRILFAPLTLFITTRVLSDLKAEPNKQTLLIGHECSHAMNKDPLKTIVRHSLVSAGRSVVFIAGILMIGKSIRPEFRQVVVPLIGYLFFGFCWVGQTVLLESFLRFMQELRADLDSIKSPADRESYLALLKGIPIHVRFEPVFTHNPWKMWRARAERRRRTSAFQEHTEQIERRIKALETENINLARELGLRKRLMIVYIVMFLGLMTTIQMFIYRLESLG
jgi:hypothetical protein